MSGQRYPNLFTRLVANTHEPENDRACWVWKGQTDGWGYGRFTVRVPGEPYPVKLMAHVAMFCCLYGQPTDTRDFWAAYQEFRASGMELDHLCNNPSCINPDHHDPVTHKINCERRDMRRRANFV